MPTKNYQQLFDTVRLSTYEIAKRVSRKRGQELSATTVQAILRKKDGQHFSKETERLVYQVLEEEAIALQKALTRLMGSAAH